MSLEVVRHADQTLTPDPTRVVVRLFMPSADPGHGDRTSDLTARVMALEEAEVEALVDQVLGQFIPYHGNLRSTLREHAFPLIPRGARLSDARQILLGAAFTAEHALEGATVCNPSVVAHPDQRGLEPGQLRVAVSLRAIGEGHFSAVEFVTAVVDDGWRFEPRQGAPVVGTVTRAPLPRALYEALAVDRKEPDVLTSAVLNLLPERVRPTHVEDILDRLPADLLLHPSTYRRAEVLRRVARSGYHVSFDPASRLDQRVLLPAVEDESRGMEDARFTLFRDEDGTAQYRGTYTAYDGRFVGVRMLSSADLSTFTSVPLGGPGATNKGMALFPRMIQGRYAALSRHDGTTNGITFSDDGLIWDHPTTIESPAAPWAIRKVGNAGSPLETPEGWLVLTHGVGFMRVYGLGALLLDLEDPTQVIGRLDRPWLLQADHSGYVPNVVYSCGGIIRGERLFVPYGIDDNQVSVASLKVEDLLGAMTRETA